MAININAKIIKMMSPSVNCVREWNYWTIQQFETEIEKNYFHTSQMIHSLNFSSRRRRSHIISHLKMLMILLPDLKTWLHQLAGNMTDVCFFVFSSVLLTVHCYSLQIWLKDDLWRWWSITTPHSVSGRTGRKKKNHNLEHTGCRFSRQPCAWMDPCVKGKVFWRLGRGGGRQRG